MLRQHRVIVVVLEIQQVLVYNFSMGLLTCFLCRWRFQMGIPHVLVLNPHWHAKVDPELALRQPGLVNSCLHTLRHLVMVAPCRSRSMSTAENKLVEDHPKLPLSLPSAHRNRR